MTQRSPLEQLARVGLDVLGRSRLLPNTPLETLAQTALQTVENLRRNILEDEEVKFFEFIAPIHRAIMANIALELSVGTAQVFALPTHSSQLVEAQLSYLGSLDFSVMGDAQRKVLLRQSSPLTLGWANPKHWTTRPHWHIGLTQDIPLDLYVKGGVGEATLDLTHLTLSNLEVEANVSSFLIKLPQHKPFFTGTVRGGAGAITLQVPADAHGKLFIRGGLGELDLIIQEGAHVRVDVLNGVGRTELVAGLDMREVSGVGILNTGVWETPNLHMANRPMSISLLDTRIGALHVRVVEAF
ncbi:MAG: hypothetical protein ACOYLB_15155 [Phototrophicaceae bacterium]